MAASGFLVQFRFCRFARTYNLASVKQSLTNACQWILDDNDALYAEAHATNVLKLIGISPKRRLRCSFCRKTDREVSKLLAGPRVFICDECVAICNGILEATPNYSARSNRLQR